MTHVRSKAAVALVAALLASCTGTGQQQAAGPADARPQAPVVAETDLAVSDARAENAENTR